MTEKQTSLDLFVKYRLKNRSLPVEFSEFINKEVTNKKYFSTLSSQEIKAYLDVYMTKKDMSLDEEKLYDSFQKLLNIIGNSNHEHIVGEIKKLKLTEKKHLYKL